MASNDLIHLKLKNHKRKLLAGFCSSLLTGDFVDCTLVAEGKYLKAHKIVLSACSPYFERLFNEHYEKHPIVILKDVTFEQLKTMIEYMYNGEMKVSQSQLGGLLKAAESLQIKGFLDCEREADPVTQISNGAQERNGFSDNHAGHSVSGTELLNPTQAEVPPYEMAHENPTQAEVPPYEMAHEDPTQAEVPPYEMTHEEVLKQEVSPCEIVHEAVLKKEEPPSEVLKKEEPSSEVLH